MTQLRIAVAAGLLGVSDDTVRRLIEAGELSGDRDAAGRKTVDGAQLAAYARRRAATPAAIPLLASSARNRFIGLVTDVVSDPVMSQVELQCGPYRVVSLMSTEAVGDLGLEPGTIGAAVVKATNVIVEVERIQV